MPCACAALLVCDVSGFCDVGCKLVAKLILILAPFYRERKQRGKEKHGKGKGSKDKEPTSPGVDEDIESMPSFSQPVRRGRVVVCLWLLMLHRVNMALVVGTV